MARRSGSPRKALTNAGKHHRTMLVRWRLPRGARVSHHGLPPIYDPLDEAYGARQDVDVFP